MRLLFESGDSEGLGLRRLSILNGNRESWTARAMVKAVDPVSFTLSKVTLGKSSSSLSLRDRRGDSPSAIRCITFLCILFSSRSGIMSLLLPSEPTPG